MTAADAGAWAPSPRRRGRLALAGVVLAGLLALASPVRAQDDGLRRLAERLVGAWGMPGDMRVSLHVASLPDDVTVALPLPPAFDLVGSLARYERGELVSVQVVLDGPARTTEAFGELRSAFVAGGWSVIGDQEPLELGFVPTIRALYARACAPEDQGGDRQVAFFNASPAGDASDVRIDLTPEAWPGACVPDPDYRGDRDRFAPLPTLAAPSGSEVTGTMVALDVEDASAHAVLRGSALVADIVEHYEAELRALGWSPLPGRLTDDFGTRSPWSLTTEAGRLWVGVLTVDRPTRTGPAMLSFSLVTEPGACHPGPCGPPRPVRATPARAGHPGPCGTTDQRGTPGPNGRGAP
jgi:hypothetical protein